MAKTFKRWFFVLFCCIATVGVLGGIKYSQISAAIAFGASFPEQSETVLAATAEETDYVPRTRVVGEIVPVRTVAISNELPGAIVEVGFAPGDTVAAGQVLIRLDISEEQAQLAAAKARMALAENTLKRNENLVSRNAISQQAVDDALATRDAARAEARRIEAVINKKILRAPFAARTGLERWEVGGYLSAASTITTLVGDGSDVWIDFSLPQQYASVDIGAPVQVSSDAGASLQASVIARAPGVDRVSRAVRYRALATDERLAGVPGAIVSVSVAIGMPVAALRVPAVAVRKDTFGDHVFTLVPAEVGADAAYRASRRAVTVLRVEAEDAYISDGLDAGEKVVAAGSFKLRDGILVNLDGGSAAERDRP